MKKLCGLFLCLLLFKGAHSWGFYAHQRINYYAVFLLPPEMLRFFKPHMAYLSEHSVDPDKRRYLVAAEGSRHYIDLDRYGTYPFDSLPRRWEDALERYGQDTLQQHGIVPWWIEVMQRRLARAFREKNGAAILKVASEIGHYIGDAHVPLHASSNHNGQKTGQQGIHGFWESRVPELLAEKEWDFFLGRAEYISQPGTFIWKRVLESAAAADTVLRIEKELTQKFRADHKYAFEFRNGTITRQYSLLFTSAYDKALKGMVERRMRQSVYAVASFWYTAWVDAGQPDLSGVSVTPIAEEVKEAEELKKAGGRMIGRQE